MHHEDRVREEVETEIAKFDAGIPTWVNGKRGKALSFDDASFDFVSLGTSTPSSALQLTGAFTLCAWVYPGALDNERTIIARVYELGNGPYAYAFGSGTNGVVSVGWSDNDVGAEEGAATGNNALRTGIWQHTCATRNAAASSAAIYVNGVSQSVTPSGDATPTTVAATTTFGRYNENSAYWDGNVDEVRIYSRELGSTEIATLAQSGAVKFTTSSVGLQQGSTLSSGLVGHWTFDGADVTTVVADRSGQGNNGYFIGGATSSAKVIGKLGQALHFDGSGDGVLVNSLLGQPSRATLSAWVNLQGVDEFGADVINVGAEIGIALNNEFVIQPGIGGGYYIGGDTWLNTTVSTDIEDTGWHHIVYLTDPSNSRQELYLDGVLVASDTFNTAIVYSFGINTTFIATGSEGETDLTGAIDDVRVYNRALSPTEIQQLYQLCTARNDAAGRTGAHWMDDCQVLQAPDESSSTVTFTFASLI